MAPMERLRFEELVAESLDGLPRQFADLLQNVEVVVEDFPSRAQNDMSRSRGLLLGLYEGVPLTVRGGGYNMVVPDKITIFQKALESMCSTEEQLKGEIRKTVQHEIAHHFGLDDAALERIEEQKRRRGRS
jgi:predicted Zn-dependent protease with MMP-like domain